MVRVRIAAYAERFTPGRPAAYPDSTRDECGRNFSCRRGRASGNISAIMRESDEIKGLLTELRDVQREHLAEYRKVTQRSLELQQQAVTRQEQLGNLYRRVLAAGAILVIFIVIIIVYLLGRLR